MGKQVLDSAVLYIGVVARRTYEAEWISRQFFRSRLFRCASDRIYKGPMYRSRYECPRHFDKPFFSATVATPWRNKVTIGIPSLRYIPFSLCVLVILTKTLIFFIRPLSALNLSAFGHGITRFFLSRKRERERGR